MTEFSGLEDLVSEAFLEVAPKPNHVLEDEDVVEASLPPEIPPGIQAPVARPAPAFVEVSAKFVLMLKRTYGPRSKDDTSRRIGTRLDVEEWIASLRPGRVIPRGRAS